MYNIVHICIKNNILHIVCKSGKTSDLVSADDEQATLAQGAQLTIDPSNLQYQFRADTGQGKYMILTVGC